MEQKRKQNPSRHPVANSLFIKSSSKELQDGGREGETHQHPLCKADNRR